MYIHNCTLKSSAYNFSMTAVGVVEDDKRRFNSKCVYRGVASCKEHLDSKTQFFGFGSGTKAVTKFAYSMDVPTLTSTLVCLAAYVIANRLIRSDHILFASINFLDSWCCAVQNRPSYVLLQST